MYFASNFSAKCYWVYKVLVFLNSCNLFKTSVPNFMALLTAELCADDHHSPLTLQALSFCASCVSEECLVTYSIHTHK